MIRNQKIFYPFSCNRPFGWLSLQVDMSVFWCDCLSVCFPCPPAFQNSVEWRLFANDCLPKFVLAFFVCNFFFLFFSLFFWGRGVDFYYVCAIPCILIVRNKDFLSDNNDGDDAAVCKDKSNQDNHSKAKETTAKTTTSLTAKIYRSIYKYFLLMIFAMYFMVWV